MALLDEDEVNLIDFILLSQAATPSSHFNLENENICEEMYRQMSSKIKNCKFLDNSNQRTTFWKFTKTSAFKYLLSNKEFWCIVRIYILS